MNRTRLIRIILLTAVVVLLTAALSHAANVPQMINYNGTLTDTSGNPVPDGQYDVQFNIYSTPTIGTALWTETWNASTTKVVTFKGSFNAMLGAHTAIPASFFADNPVTYLGVKVGTDSEMLPRQRIMSVGYAFTAGDGIPKGGIIMWSGAVDQIPSGWALCDGTNGTPNLRDRFVVGAGPSYNVGATGGSNTKDLSHVHTGPSHVHSTAGHALTINEMPSHNHANGSYQYLLQYTGGNTNSDTDSSANEPDIKNKGAILNVGSNAPHNHGDTGASGTDNTGSGGSLTQDIRPPYYALAFIMKL